MNARYCDTNIGHPALLPIALIVFLIGLLIKKIKGAAMNIGKYYDPRTLGSHPAVCDVCGGKVGFGSYVYLCRECHGKLPEHIQEGHHAMVDYPAIRQGLLRDAVKRNKK